MKSLKRHLLFLLPLSFLTFISFVVSARESEDIWRNSVAMMNYLEVTAQEIDSAETNQITLDEIYSSLVSNIYPNAVDEKTQVFLTRLLDSIEAYRMIDTRRLRLDDYFQQEKAKAIGDALPNPVDLLTSVIVLDLSSLVEMTAGSAIDYYSNLESLELERMEEEWDLDDEAGSVFHSLRKEAFSYMLDIVRTYDIPGEYALSEAAVSDYVQYRHISNVRQRIQFLESSREEYEVYANYWLALAEDYYTVGAYAECLDAVDQYEKSASRIFRKDHDYARILPMAVVAAQAVKQTDDFETYASQRAEQIIVNTDNDEWSLRYFAAQTYLSLYLSTRWKPYLDASYDILLNNVNELVSVQIRKNSDYLKGTDPEQDLLPPVYEPLVLNLNSLYLLAQELNIPQTEWERIDGILHENGEDLFLVKPIDLVYRKENGEEAFPELQKISFENLELSVPVSYVSEDALIKAGLYQKGTWTFYTDWYLSRIQQKKGGRAAFYESQDIKDPAIPFQTGDILWIGIQPKAGSTCTPFAAAFTVKEISSTFFQQKVIFTGFPVDSLPPLPEEAYQDLQADGSLLLPDQPGLPEESSPQAAGYETSQDIASAFLRLERELAEGNTSEEILEEISRLESTVNEISPLSGAVLTSLKYSIQYEETSPEALLKLLNIAKERLPEEIRSAASE